MRMSRLKPRGSTILCLFRNTSVFFDHESHMVDGEAIVSGRRMKTPSYTDAGLLAMQAGLHSSPSFRRRARAVCTVSSPDDQVRRRAWLGVWARLWARGSYLIGSRRGDSF